MPKVTLDNANRKVMQNYNSFLVHPGVWSICLHNSASLTLATETVCVQPSLPQTPLPQTMTSAASVKTALCIRNKRNSRALHFNTDISLLDQNIAKYKWHLWGSISSIPPLHLHVDGLMFASWQHYTFWLLVDTESK